MTSSTATIIGIPGTLCSSAIFGPFSDAVHSVAPGIGTCEVSWMTGPGPWDLRTIAASIAVGIDREAGPTVLVGHSTGGAIAMEIVINYPDLVHALVLVNTGPNMHHHGDVDSILDAVRDGWGEELREAILQRSFNVLPPDAVMEELRRFARTCEQRAALEVLTSQRDQDFEPRLSEIACPALVAHGVLDPVRTVAQAEALVARIPGAELLLLDCGHTPPYEAPSDLADAVLQIVRRIGA